MNNNNNLQSLEDRFSLGPTPPNGGNLPSSLGSGTYQFLALTGTQQSANSNKPRRQQQQKYVRRPNYSNEDLVDDLSRGHNNQFNSQDEILFDDFAQGAVNQSDIMMCEIDYPQVPQNESNIYDNQESTDFINEPMTNAFGSQAEMDEEDGDENEDISDSMQIPPPIIEDEQEQERLESLKYIETTIDQQPLSHDNSKNPIIIEDQQAIINSQRVQFQENQILRNEELEETHDFPQIQQNNNDSMVENYYDHQFKNYSQQLFVGCLIKQSDRKVETKIQVNLSRPRSARNQSVSKSLSFQERGQLARPSLEIDTSQQKETPLGLFTSNSPSGYLLKFNRNVGMNIDEARQILQSQDDIQTFIQTFDNEKSFLNVFGFDSCVNETYGHRQLNLNNQVVRFLQLDGTQRHQSFKQSTQGSIITNSSIDHLPNDFVFLFGQHSANKSDVFNSLKPESLINRFIDTLQEQIKFLRVSLFYQEQEYVIIQRSFNQSNPGAQKRDLQMELRQAQRNRASLIKKLASNSRKLIADQERLQSDMKKASHYVIQINNHIFADLGGIECLNSSTNPLLVQSLTHNFGSVTNQILKLSPFYANHDFNPSELQEQSLFNTYLKSQLTANSRVALICCVSSDPKLNPQTMIALDYCHKIKCYFNGITEEEVKNRLKQEYDTGNVIEMARIHRLREIGGLYQSFWRIKANKVGKRTRVISPKSQMTIEGLKERALQISRMSEDPSGSTSDEKRLMTILLKEIETFIVNRNEMTPRNITPIKTLTSIKSQGHLRMRTGSASRSSTSLAGPYMLIIQSNKRQKPTHNSSQKQKSRSQSRHFQSHVHMIPTASHDNENRSNRKSNNRSRQQSHKGSKASSASKSPNVRRQRASSKNSASRAMRPGSIENPNFSVDPTIFEDYNRHIIMKGSETLQADSRDTPQFQHDSLSHQLNNSSLYVRTSGPSSIKGQNQRTRRTSNKGGINSSQFNSLAPKLPMMGVNQELYCETTDKKGGVRRILSSTQKQRRQIISSTTVDIRNGMQDSIRQIEDEQENSMNYSNQLPRLDLAVNSNENSHLQKEVALYKSQFEVAQLNLQQLSEKFTQLEQTSLKHKQSYSAKLDDLSSQLKDKEKMIESLEFQLDTSNKELGDLRTQMDSLNHETAESQETQRLVIQQISNMKRVIEDQKESERGKEQLLIKLKSKDQRIRELTKQLHSLTNQPESGGNTDDIARLQHENDQLNLQHAQKLEVFEQRFQKIYHQYKKAIEENQQLLEANKSLEKRVTQAEKAQENYKDQVIELKHDLKRAKAVGRVTASSSRIEENATVMKDGHDECQLTENDNRKSRDKQKEVVLGDIRNLIQEYKKERLVANSSLTR